ncbi:MAG TPA: DUF3189 family protein [Syntrophomonadaceae bacterium]|jgi:hypothetical protein|nr:DUF3189 family protein [Syntrophomonadaceae bacterium]HOQ09879.1 DUF3189 family protein [Syntrophomonadaceae bacterium]HPU48079.1 DUF3189 family protein [Syntrophomonadaceae bacterium]
MNIMFISNTGVHHALIAANIFLGRLHNPNFRYIKGFCDVAHDKSGFPIYIGEDNQSRKVYTLGVGKDVLMAKKTLEDLRDILGFTERELVIEPVSVPGESLIKFCSRWPKILGGAHLNALVSTYILRRQFHVIQKTVEDLQGRLKEMH